MALALHPTIAGVTVFTVESADKQRAARQMRPGGGAVRRTLLAVGIAVLASMLLAPHGDKYGVKGFGPFFSTHGFAGSPWNPGWWRVGRVVIDMLTLEAIFLVVLSAAVVNI